MKQRTFGRKLFRWFVLFVAVPYLAVMILFASFQRHLIFPGARDTSPVSAPHGAAFDEIFVKTHDGLELHGWLVADGGIDALKSSERPVVLFFPGNAGNRGNRWGDLTEIQSLGYDAVLFDYRGYGDNDGSPSQKALVQDALAVCDLLEQEYGITSDRLTILGESLGGGVAIQTASELSKRGTPPARLAVYSTFSSLSDVAALHYPYFPVRWLIWDRFDSVQAIQTVTCPIAIAHGTSDDLIPLSIGKRLFEAAPKQSESGVPKEFHEIANRGHNDISRDALGELLKGPPT